MTSVMTTMRSLAAVKQWSSDGDTWHEWTTTPPPLRTWLRVREGPLWWCSFDGPCPQVTMSVRLSQLPRVEPASALGCGGSVSWDGAKIQFSSGLPWRHPSGVAVLDQPPVAPVAPFVGRTSKP